MHTAMPPAPPHRLLPWLLGSLCWAASLPTQAQQPPNPADVVRQLGVPGARPYTAEDIRQLQDQAVQAALAKQAQQLKKLEQSISTLTQEREQLRHERDQAQTQLKAAQSSHNRADQEAKQDAEQRQAQKLKKLEQALATLTQERDQLRRERDQAQTELQQAQNKLAAAQSEPTPRVAPLPQPAVPPVSQTGQVFKDCQEAHCPEMVVIPAGSFTMGSNEHDSEKPPHSVNVRSFALGKYAVTKGQFAAFVSAKGYRTEAEQGDGCYGWSGSTWEKNTSYNWRNVGFAQGNDHPVVCVSWNDAQAYVQWLSQSTGKAYRLPSEAEREHAARAGTTSKYWWGDTASHEYANYGKDQCCGPLAQGRDQWKYTSPVGQFPANGFGLHDMHGNTWDWLQDVWHDNYAGAPYDGSAWTTGGDASRRVLRGGSWGGDPDDLRSASRIRYSPDGRLDYFGFRLARTVP